MNDPQLPATILRTDDDAFPHGATPHGPASTSGAPREWSADRLVLLLPAPLDPAGWTGRMSGVPTHGEDD